MNGSAATWILVAMGTMALTKSTWTASIDADEVGSVSKIFDDDADDRIASLESRPTNVSDDVDDMLPPVNVERRRAKNFRGDLGKRARSSRPTGNSRLRPDLGKRSASFRRQSAEGRTNGMRLKLRPDLGKRVVPDDESYFRWLSDFRSGSVGEQHRDDNENDESAGNDFPSTIGDRREEDDALGRLSEAKRARGSSFRGDLGKRSAEAQGDIEGSPLVNLDDLIGGVDEEQLLKRGKSSFRGDLGKRMIDAFGDGSAAIDKRPRSSSSFRGDLGKRRSSPDGLDQPNDVTSLAKRPRSQSFRGDLG